MRRRSFNPFIRWFSKGRVSGLEDALMLLRYEAERAPLPCTITGRPHPSRACR